MRARKENKATEEGRKAGGRSALGLRQKDSRRKRGGAHQLTTSERMSTHPMCSSSKAKPVLQASGWHCESTQAAPTPFSQDEGHLRPTPPQLLTCRGIHQLFSFPSSPCHATTHVGGEVAEVGSEPRAAESSLAQAGEVGRGNLLSRDGGRSEGKSCEEESRVEHVDAWAESRFESWSCEGRA